MIQQTQTGRQKSSLPEFSTLISILPSDSPPRLSSSYSSSISSSLILLFFRERDLITHAITPTWVMRNSDVLLPSPFFLLLAFQVWVSSFVYSWDTWDGSDILHVPSIYYSRPWDTLWSVGTDVDRWYRGEDELRKKGLLPNHWKSRTRTHPGHQWIRMDAKVELEKGSGE